MTRKVEAHGAEAGVSLVEVLVAMMLFSIVAAVVAAVASANVAAHRTTQITNDLNEQARVTLNRMARELRQARAIESVLVDPVTGALTGLTFTVDFNGDGTIDGAALDPERLTYCYRSPTSPGAGDGAVMLTAGSVSNCSDPASLPVLDSQVTELVVDLRSSDWTADGACGSSFGESPQPDGRTQWQEVNCAMGYAPELTPSPTVLAGIDSVGITLRVLRGTQQQVYRTEVDMRNRS